MENVTVARLIAYVDTRLIQSHVSEQREVQ